MDVESQVLQTVDEVKGLLVFGAMVEVVSAEILVEGSGLEHMVSGSEQGGGGYGSDSFLGAAAAAQAVVLGLEVAVLSARGRPGALH